MSFLAVLSESVQVIFAFLDFLVAVVKPSIGVCICIITSQAGILPSRCAPDANNILRCYNDLFADVLICWRANFEKVRIN